MCVCVVVCEAVGHDCSEHGCHRTFLEGQAHLHPAFSLCVQPLPAGGGGHIPEKVQEPPSMRSEPSALPFGVFGAFPQVAVAHSESVRRTPEVQRGECSGPHLNSSVAQQHWGSPHPSPSSPPGQKRQVWPFELEPRVRG